MKNFWKIHKIKLVALLYVFASGMIFYFAIFPLASQIAKKSDEIQERMLDSQMENSRLEAIDRMEEDSRYARENSKALEVLLNKEEEVNFIKKLENIAQETGNIINLKVEDSQAKKPPASAKKKDEEKTIRESLSYDSYIYLQIDLKGSYLSFVEFLNKLENTRNYINIISLESKVEKEAVENSQATQPFRELGVFYPSADKQIAQEKKDKYLVHSVIGVVIYTKK